MGLTRTSVGSGALYATKEKRSCDMSIALAGNPNVGKSTVFNELTGMKQHTGNWPGKTVAIAEGICEYNGLRLLFTDIPGTYSLLPHSPEEEIARDFIAFGGADCVAVICDATCLERNLNLVLQICEITKKVVVCINLMDEARKKGIVIDTAALERELGVSVTVAEARHGKGLSSLCSNLLRAKDNIGYMTVSYPPEIEECAEALSTKISEVSDCPFPRFCALRLLSRDSSFAASFKERYDFDLSKYEGIATLLDSFSVRDTSEKISETLNKKATEIYKKAVSGGSCYTKCAEILDRIVTSRALGFPIMLLGLTLIFWLTIVGANYPSAYLSALFGKLEAPIYNSLVLLQFPRVVASATAFGVFRVLAWIVSVMLPPMAIFFPLFTLLEDSGYLPRVAFNLDRVFLKCNACGKQSLTMCMGFGCNAAGVVGCRIIDSPRERLIAILTNTFIPCNGRFPALISIITMFFVGVGGGFFRTITASLILVLFVLAGVGMTFPVSKLLSRTLCRGYSSNFTLELPPYRRPQIIKVLIRSFFDRTIFVLGRAVSVAAPAGLIIWLMANITIGGTPILLHLSGFLDPFARLLGLDGVILTAFILALPANEIVLPLAIMAYSAAGTLTEISDLASLSSLLVQNGWTVQTAISFMLFSIFHWPCSTTLLSIKKETGSIFFTLLAFLIPTLLGLFFCVAVNLVFASFRFL